MASIGLYARRRPKKYYVRGVKGGHTTSGVVTAHDKDDARDEFREEHPGYKVIQVNERD